MLGKTKRKKGTKSRVRKRRDNKNNKSEADAPPLADCQGNLTYTVDDGMMYKAGDSEDDRKEVNPDKMNSDDKDNKGESLDYITARLTDQEVGTNTNTSFISSTASTQKTCVPDDM